MTPQIRYDFNFLKKNFFLEKNLKVENVVAKPLFEYIDISVLNDEGLTINLKDLESSEKIFSKVLYSIFSNFFHFTKNVENEKYLEKSFSLVFFTRVTLINTLQFLNVWRFETQFSKMTRFDWEKKFGLEAFSCID
jgi:hypothetical protein